MALHAQERRRLRAERRKASGRAIAASLFRAAATEVWAESRAELDALARRYSNCAFNQRIVSIIGSDDVERVVVKNERACKGRGCPSCESHRCEHFRAIVRLAMNCIWQHRPGTRVIALTLTSKNQPLSDLEGMLEFHSLGLRKLFALKGVRAATLGALHSFEIAVRGTREEPEAGVHSHHLVLVEPGFFFDERWIDHAQWRELWARSLGVSYLPMVHVKPADDIGENADPFIVYREIGHAIKYACKPHSYIEGDCVDHRVVLALTHALKGRRLVRHDRLMSAGLKQARKLRKQCSTPKREANAS